MTVQVKSLHADNYNEAHTECQITVHQPTILNEVCCSKTLITEHTIHSLYPLHWQNGVHLAEACVSAPSLTWWVSCVVVPPPTHTTGIISSSYTALPSIHIVETCIYILTSASKPLSKAGFKGISAASHGGHAMTPVSCLLLSIHLSSYLTEKEHFECLTGIHFKIKVWLARS